MGKNELNHMYPCPCCGYFTLSERPPGTYDICPVCNWEDDEVQYLDPDLDGGANVESLNQAKKNFKLFKVSSKQHFGKVRDPFDDELP